MPGGSSDRWVGSLLAAPPNSIAVVGPIQYEVLRICGASLAALPQEGFQEMQDTGPVLQRLQMEAYRAVLRAMAVAPLQYVSQFTHSGIP